MVAVKYRENETNARSSALSRSLSSPSASSEPLLSAIVLGQQDESRCGYYQLNVQMRNRKIHTSALKLLVMSICHALLPSLLCPVPCVMQCLHGVPSHFLHVKV